MEFHAIDRLENRKQAGLLVIPFRKGKKQAEVLGHLGKLASYLSGPIEAGDFAGKEGEVVFLYAKDLPEKRLALLGLGDAEKLTLEKLRRAYASLAKACRSRKIQEINLLLPEGVALGDEVVVRGVCEGLLLANYVFNKLKCDVLKEDFCVLLQKASLIGASKQTIAIAHKCAAIAEGVYLTRDLINDNADTVTPQYLANVAKELAKKLPHVKTTVFDLARIEKEKMGLLLAVGRGAIHPPVFIIAEYKGNPKSTDHTVLIGKGITYDTGGLHLKSGAGMDTMRCDMGGAAVTLGVLDAAARLKLKRNLTVVIPAAENAISAMSYKPGDVYSGLGGKTVEITSTDAEGRLVLADALAYAVKKLKPTRMVDFATLTGGIDIALGAEVTGMMSNSNELAEAFTNAGLATYERVWRMPLYEEYREQLRSEIADMKNTGGRSASSITASMFLQEFVGDVPWVHFDIASTAFLSDHRRYHPKYATGIGVRLMIEFLENL